MRTPLAAGSLIHRIRLQVQTPSFDATAGDTLAYRDVAVLAARVETTGGRAFYEAKRTNNELTHQVTMRYRADVLAGVRLLFGDTVLTVVAPMDPDGARVQLLVLCSEVTQ